MNRTEKKLRKLEREFYRRIYKEFKGVKRWNFFSDVHSGHFTFLMTCRETKKEK